MKAPVLKFGFLAVVIGLILVGMTAGVAFAGQDKIVTTGSLTRFTPGNPPKAGAIDFANAKPLALPIAKTAPVSVFDGGASTTKLGVPGFAPGSPPKKASAPEMAIDLGAIDEAFGSALGEDQPSQYGTSYYPFSTSRVDLDTSSGDPSKLYPYRAAGKLYFNIGSSTYVCSASLVKKGVIVTAAHCVANYGQKQFYTNWTFVPALSGSLAPYGTWSAQSAFVLSAYYYGTNPCQNTGVVCQDDVAVIVLSPKSGYYPGYYTGWLGYGWNNWGFTGGPKLAQIAQLGYPSSHDSGTRMQRTDTQAYVSTMINNTVWGSSQTGGSSGGPLVANLGVAPVLSGVSTGTYPDTNIVIGVTNWGYTDTTVKLQGGSPFTTANIYSLITGACNSYAAACAN